MHWSPSICSASTTSAPISTRFVFAGLSSVSSGFPDSASLRAKASVLLPEAACAIKTRWARSATRSLRWAATSAVGRRAVAGKGDRTSRRPSSRAGRQSQGIRMLSMPRAGQTTTGWVPRISRRRHSRSIGVWKPPMTGTPASRMALARS